MFKSNLEIKYLEPDLTLLIQVVEFVGVFDKAGHLEVRAPLDEFIKAFALDVLLFDFSEMSFINSEGIGYLIEVNSFLQSKNKKFIIVGLKKNVEDVFDAIGIKQIIPVYNSYEEYKLKFVK